MSAWPEEDLRRIAEADDLHMSPFREDGVTNGTPTWVWSVAVDDALYVRAYRGLSDFSVAHRFVANYLWKLPSPAGSLRHVLGGWETSGI